MALNVEAITILQFKYKYDQDSPPKEMIKIIFDDNNTIVGIKPLKMQNSWKKTATNS